MLEDRGVTVTYDNSRLPTSCSASLDSANFVGTIIHWPELRFEFQFNHTDSGDVALLETRDFYQHDELVKYIDEIFRTALK